MATPPSISIARGLAFDDLLHYQCFVATLAETRALMARIDAAIDRAGGWPLE